MAIVLDAIVKQYIFWPKEYALSILQDKRRIKAAFVFCFYAWILLAGLFLLYKLTGKGDHGDHLVGLPSDSRYNAWYITKVYRYIFMLVERNLEVWRIGKGPLSLSHGMRYLFSHVSLLRLTAVIWSLWWWSLYKLPPGLAEAGCWFISLFPVQTREQKRKLSFKA